MHTPEQLWARFEALDQFLTAHRSVWHSRAFVECPTQWELEHPEAGAYIDSQPLDHFGPDRRWLGDAPAVLKRWAKDADLLGILPALPDHRAQLKPPFHLRVPGRKLEQIERFAGQVLTRWTAPKVVSDWCAGKGHLGRTLAHTTGAKLQALEWNDTLCAAGRARCIREGINAEFTCVDVHNDAVLDRLKATDWVVALHACGGLHTRLLRAAATQRVPALALAPCCYNQPALDRGQPLSQAGQTQGRVFEKSDLDLIHRQPANAGIARLRRCSQSQRWRLAFDTAHRQMTGIDRYRPMPSFPKAWLKLSFPEFCRRFGPLDNVELPQNLDWAALLRAGEVASEAITRRDAVRALFIAPMEAWLVLDRALFMVEAGYRVTVGTFCTPSLTPRNALILAEI